MTMGGPDVHVLACGSPRIGRTSLLLALARDCFVKAENLPRRFEGWTITVDVAPESCVRCGNVRNVLIILCAVQY